ncbi:type I-E CRISPR-associated protein Cas7/Cse4/CasC [Rhodovibrio sodomensis]|uniref:Type I-E CRISPR-associated protein Cas7/Cse4/CasC n=1 Tax=Rhodovibrio sodomensis TaxID=1088 RepID=A0ABS1DIE0_9PROT|nr:type I-E CRISPR-associated protein Cas7/Cse4/CasC [Rhodovibrio sodomensis]MBK1669503.1 type I-E CRISPR-associated protein Cas7/Cse4/CasC [Rhodovibrio sodomensis]
MTDFVQIHFLTAYPASCLVRDDTGRPKTMTFGGMPRGRISSAALKRAVRTSDEFRGTVEDRVGQRTQMLGTVIRNKLVEEDIAEETAVEAARSVAAMFGRIKPENADAPTEIEQLAFIDPQEVHGAIDVARRYAAGDLPADEAEKEARHLIQGAVTATDIALFGRMFADRPEMRMNAAAEVAHPFTVDRADTEIDYYVAVDDLNDRSEDAGSAFIGEQGFLSGLFYGYANVNKDLLTRNLDGDRALADQALAGFLRGVATVAPIGKRAPFGSRARASYLRIERGASTPRSLAAAFLSPVAPPRTGQDETLLSRAIKALEGTAEGFDQAYGDGPAAVTLNVSQGIGTLSDCIAHTQGAPTETQGT